MNRILFSLFLTLLIFTAFAQKIPFQGKLTQDDEPFTGNVTMEFSIPDISWTEIHEGVGVLDGFYSVVLGEVTPLPDSIFRGTDEHQLNIKVDGTELSSVKIYRPVTGGPPAGGNVEVRNAEGKLKAELNYSALNDAGSVVLNGANDSTKVILGSAAGGYGGYLGLYDSLRNIGAQLRVTSKGVGNLYTYDANHRNTGWFGNGSGTGGFSQIVGYNQSGNFTGATLTGFASWNNGLPYFFMEGSSEDPYVQLIQFGGHHDGISEKPYFHMTSTSRGINGIGSALSMGMSQQDQAFIELKGGNDRNWDMRAQIRVDSVNTLGTAGRIELFGPLGNENNDVSSLFSVNAVNDPESPDPSGASAEMFLWGTSTPNFQLGGKPWEENNHPYFQMFGSKTDGGGWYNANIELDVHSVDIYDASTINLNNTADGASYNTVQIMSNGSNSSGQLTLRNPDAGDRIVLLDDELNGGSLQLIASNGSSSMSAVDLVLSGENGQTIFMDAHSGVIEANEFVGILSEPSDERLKENIKPQKNSLEKIKQLRGVTYEWKKDESDARNIGFIAQEVEKIYPEVVHTKADGFKSVNYAALVSALVEAVKKLDAKVVSLEAENEELKARLENNENEGLAGLKAEIEAIKKLLGTYEQGTSVSGASK